MTIFGRERHPHEVPEDSPDLAYVMGFVTGVGGLSVFTSCPVTPMAIAYWTRRSVLGLAAGLGVGAAFGIGGYWIQTPSFEKHEFAHQICLIASVLFGGAMAYRAGSNPYVGPGGSMLAALGGVSSAYHFKKMLEWRAYEQSRILEAERLLRDYQYKHPDASSRPRPGPLVPPPEAGMEPPRGPRGRPYGAPPPHQQPAAGPAAAAHSGPPHLERRSPVPPGGF